MWISFSFAVSVLHKVTKNLISCNISLVTVEYNESRPRVSDLSMQMHSHGVTSMATDQIAKLLNIPWAQVRVRLTAQRRAGTSFRPRVAYGSRASGAGCLGVPDRMPTSAADVLYRVRMLPGWLICVFAWDGIPSDVGVPGGHVQTRGGSGGRSVAPALLVEIAYRQRSCRQDGGLLVARACVNR